MYHNKHLLKQEATAAGSSGTVVYSTAIMERASMYQSTWSKAPSTDLRPADVVNANATKYLYTAIHSSNQRAQLSAATPKQTIAALKWLRHPSCAFIHSSYSPETKPKFMPCHHHLVRSLKPCPRLISSLCAPGRVSVVTFRAPKVVVRDRPPVHKINIHSESRLFADLVRIRTPKTPETQ